MNHLNFFIGTVFGFVALALPNSVALASDCEVFVRLNSSRSGAQANDVRPRSYKELSGVFGGSEIESALRVRGVSIAYAPIYAGMSVSISLSCAEISRGTFTCATEVSAIDVSSYPPRHIFKGASSGALPYHGTLASALNYSLSSALQGIETDLCR